MGGAGFTCQGRQRTGPMSASAPMISVEALHVPPAPSSHVFLLICGFITEDDDKAESWDGLLALLAATHGDDAVYAVQWPADSLSSLIAVGSLAALGAALVGSALAECFTPEEKKDSKGAKIAKTGAGAASAVVGFGAAAAYKFSAAQGRAERCAVELAGLLNAFACEGRHVTLVGHSLGGRMILHALKHAHDCGIDVDVQDVVLMGAACNGASGTWMGGLSLVRGLVVNLHNANDGLLSEVYRRISGESCVAGVHGLQVAFDGLKTCPVVYNADCSQHDIGLFGHSYHPTLAGIWLDCVQLSPPRAM